MRMNPLIPTAYDVAWSVIAFAVATYVIVALISLMRDANATGARFLLWFAFILLVPIVGATFWFVARGRRGVIEKPSRR